jgi:hypothetical protein
MDLNVILVICAVLATIALGAIAVALVRTLAQVRRTASEAEVFLARAQPVVDQLGETLREVRLVTDKLNVTVGHAERLAASFEGVGAKAARASSVVLGGLGGPIGRAFAIFNGVKTGLRVLSQLRNRDQAEFTEDEREEGYLPSGH